MDARFRSGIFWNYLSLAILAGSGILLHIAIARFAGSEALGIFNQTFAFYIVASQLGAMGIAFSTLQAVSHHQDRIDTCAEIGTAAALAVVPPAIIVTIMTFLISERVADLLDSEGVGEGLTVIAPGLLFYALNKVLLGIANGLRRMRAYAFFQSFRFALILTFLGLLLYWQVRPGYLAFAFTLAEVVLFLMLTTYVTARLFRPVFSPSRLAPHLRAHYSYGLRGVASGALIELNTRVDVLMLGYFLSDKHVGIYSFAAIIVEGYKEIPNVVRWNIDPIVGKLLAEGRKEKVTAFSRQVRRYMVPAMASLALVGLMLYRPVIEILAFDTELLAGFQVLLILVSGVVINSVFSPMMGVLLQGGRPGVHSMLTLGVFGANVLLNLILIQMLGMLGAAWATAAVFVLEGLMLKLLAQRVIGVRI